MCFIAPLQDLFATTEKRQLMQAKEAEKLEKEKKLEQLKEKVSESTVVRELRNVCDVLYASILALF